MAGTLSTAELLSAVYNRGNIPQNSVRFTASDLITIATEELRNTVYPVLLGVHEEFFLSQTQVDFTTHADTGYFPIPKRAYARGLREITYTDTGYNVFNIPYITLADANFYPANNPSYISTRNPLGFYFYNDAVKFVGNVTSVLGTLQMTIVTRAPVLLGPDSTNKVIGFAPTSYTAATATPTSAIFVCNTISSNVYSGYTLANTTPATAAKFDIFRASTGAMLFIEVPLSVANASSTTTTFTDDTGVLTSTALNGIGLDEIIITPSEQYGYVPVPPEANQLLVIAICNRVYEALGYTEDLQTGEALMQKITKDLQQIYGDRITGEPRVLANRRGVGVFTLFGRRGTQTRRRTVAIT